jgi:transposase-like protein
MARVSKFTDEQKLQVALDLLGGKLSHTEICRKYDISSTYACKLKNRALDILREGIGAETERTPPQRGPHTLISPRDETIISQDIRYGLRMP